MEPFYTLVRIRRIDGLVYLESTGTPKQFADKLGISERMLYRYIKYIAPYRSAYQVFPNKAKLLL